MTMIDRLEQFLHVVCSFFLAECLVLLLSDLVEELLAADVLHDQVNVFVVVVCLEVFHDVRMVELVENSHFFDDAVDVLL